MTKILLCSETFIKEHTNLSDNLSGAYLGPAIRETQDIELTEYLGSALVDKLCELVSSGTITETANAKYKAILDQAQYFLAYSSIAKVIPICSIKLDNFGASQSQDENIRTLGIEDLSTVTGWYQKKADTYAKKLMRYVLSVKSEIPELNECAAGQIKSHLNSAASTGLFLGGNRGRKVGGGSCCGGTSGGHSGGGGEGSVVTWEQTVTGGTKIATISIDGKSTEVFVPEGISEEEVSELISQAIETETARTENTYAKTGTTEDLDERLTDVESELSGLEVPSVYYIDGDSINNYSDVIDEIYRKLASGETVFVGSKYDYAKFPVGKAEIYEYQESDPSNPSEYLRREGFSVPVTRTDGADSYLLRYGTFSAFRYEGRDGEGHSAGLSWTENTLAISPLTLTAKISTGGTIYMNGNEDNNSNNLDKLYRLTKDSRNGIIMAKVYDLRINSAIGYTPVRFLGASSGNNDFYSFAKFTFDYTDTDGKTYRTLWTWDRSQPAATRIVLDSCEEVSEGAKTYILNLMTNEERAALFDEIASDYPSGSYDTISSGFPVSDYQFYYYFESNGDYGTGFVPLRITRVTPQIVINFEGIRNGYVGRNFKEVTVEVNSQGNLTLREYYCSVFSLNGQNGALNLKTINNESILGTGDISVGGSDNYQIVDNISEVQNPQTGTRVYVHSGSTVETYDGIAFDASTVSEGYVVKVFDGQGNKYFDIYRSGDNFFWNWENDGNIHSRTANGKLFYYKSDTTNHIFYLFPADTATTLDLQEMGEGVTTASTSTGVTVTWGAQSLMYDGAEYVPTSDIIYDLDSMTQSEIAALNAYLNSASESERVGAHIYKNKIKCRYSHIESGKVRFYSHYIENDSGFAYIRNYIFFIKPDGTFEYLENGKEYGIPATFAVNYSTHTLTSTNTPMWAAARGITKGVAPVVYLLSGSTGVAVAKDAYIERTGDWNGIIGATFEYSGETINAKWSYDQNTATLISWRTGSTGGDYVVVESLSEINAPKEGMIAFVPEHTETMSGYTIDINAAGSNSCILRQYNPRERRWRIHTQWSEGFITCEEGGYWLRYGADNAYHSFFNDAIYAKYDGSQYITVLFDSSVYTPDFNTSADNYTETSDTVTKSARTYIYRYGSWRLYENGRITFYLNTMTQTTFNAMVNDIQLMKTPEVQFAVDYQASLYTKDMQHFLFPISTTTVQNNRLEGLGFLYAVNDNYGDSFSNLYITNVHLEVGQSWQEWKLMLVNVKDYILTVASASNLGGVKVGNGLAIDENGVLSVS